MTYETFAAGILADASFPVTVNRKLGRTVLDCAIREWIDPPPPGHLADFVAFRDEWVRRTKVRVRAGMNPLLLVVLMAVLSGVVRWVVEKLLDYWVQDRFNHGNELWKFRRELEHAQQAARVP